MFKLILLLALLLPLSLMAGPRDSSIWKKPKIFLQLDKYNSIVEGKGANVTGLKGGVEIGRKYRFGLGYYSLKSDIVEIKHLTPAQASEAPADSVKALLRMRYYPLCFEYIFYDKEKWQISFPVNLGFGNTYFEYFDKNNNTRKLKDHTVMLTDIALSGQYKILKWVGIGAGVGYRIMLIDNPAVERNFDSPLYNIRIKIFLGEIFRTAFPNGILGKRDKK